MKIIDHLVYCVPDLGKGIADIEKRFGVAPVFGGQHLTQGTQNALLNLGNGCYFEILAPDPKNRFISPLRWMGIDLITSPKITRWAFKSEAFEEELSILKKENSKLGTFFAGSRKTILGDTLNWKMSLPQPEPEVEIFPFMLDWKDSVHPTKNLPEACRLIELRATHPNPELFQRVFEKLKIEMKIEKSNEISLIAKIKTPHGVIEI